MSVRRSVLGHAKTSMCRLLGAALIVALVASLLSATAPRAEADAGLPTQTRLTLQGPTGVFQAGTAMTFTATVWPSDATGTVTFSVQYPDSIDIQPIATVPVTAGQATMTTNSLPASDNVSGVVISSFHSATSQYTDAAPGDPTNMWPVALTYLTPVVTLQLPANPAAGSQASATVTVRTPQAPTGAGTMVVDAAGGGRVQLFDLSPDGLRPFSAETPVINGSASVPFAAPPVGGIHLIYAEYSGSRYARGADSAQQLLVPVPGTSIVLSTTATCPLTAGATIPVTAKVSPVATGSVQFSVHGSPAGAPVPVDTGGVAVAQITVDTSTPTIGASFAPTNPTTLAPATVTAPACPVMPPTPAASTTTTIGPAATTVTFGTAVNVTATVATKAGPVAAGAVTFQDTGVTPPKTLAAASLSDTGQAVASIRGLAAGKHTIRATFSPVALSGLTTSTSTASITVAKLQPTLTITPRAGAGGSVDLQATVTPTVPGSVVLSDDTIAVRSGSVPLDGAGSASFRYVTTVIGPHQLSATFTPDDTTNVAPSSAQLSAVVYAPKATTTAVSAAPNQTCGSESFQATVNPPLATDQVLFVEGTVVVGSAPIDATGRATWTAGCALAPGWHAIAAQVAPTTGYLSSTSPPVTVQVAKLPTTVSVTAPASTSAGQGSAVVTVTPPVAGTLTLADQEDLSHPLGSLALAATQTPVSTAFSLAGLATGSRTLVATFVPADPTRIATAKATAMIAVQAIATTMTLVTNPVRVSPNQPVTFTATLTAGGSAGPLSGTVAVSVNGGWSGAVVTPTASGGQASVVLPTGLPTGAFDVGAVFSPSPGSRYVASQASLRLVVTDPGQTATRVTVPQVASPGVVKLVATVSEPPSLEASSRAMGAVQFSDGGVLLGTAPASGGIAELAVTLGAGDHRVGAAYQPAPGTGLLPSVASPVTLPVHGVLDLTAEPTMSANAAFAVTVSPPFLVSDASGLGTVSLVDDDPRATVLGTASFPSAAVGEPRAVVRVSAPLEVRVHTLTATLTSASGVVLGTGSVAVTITPATITRPGVTGLADSADPELPIPVNSRLSLGYSLGSAPTYSPAIASRVGAERAVGYMGGAIACPVVMIQAWDRLTLQDLVVTPRSSYPTADQSPAEFVNCPSQNGTSVRDRINALKQADRLLPQHDPDLLPIFVINTITNGTGTGSSWRLSADDAMALKDLGMAASLMTIDLAATSLSLIADGGPAGSAYSCTANLAADNPAGASLTVATPTPCDLRGYLAQTPVTAPNSATHYWAFSPMQSVSYELHAAGSVDSTNVIRVGTSRFTQTARLSRSMYDEMTLPPDTAQLSLGGFHLVVLDGRLRPLIDTFFTTRVKASGQPNQYSPSGLDALNRALAGLAYDGTSKIVLLAGTNAALPRRSDLPASLLPGYLTLAGHLRELAGDTEDLLLDGNAAAGVAINVSVVAFVRGGTYSPGPVAELAVDPSVLPNYRVQGFVASPSRTPANPSGNLSGLLTLGHFDNTWIPEMGAPGSGVYDLQDSVPAPQSDQAYAGSYPVPSGCHPPEIVSGAGCDADAMAAFTWFGHQLLDASVCQPTDNRCAQSLRVMLRTGDNSGSLQALGCQASGCPTALVNACAKSAPTHLVYPTNATFSCDAYDLVRRELQQEIVRDAAALVTRDTIDTALGQAVQGANATLVRAWASIAKLLLDKESYNAGNDNTALVNGLIDLATLLPILIPGIGELALAASVARTVIVDVLNVPITAAITGWFASRYFTHSKYTPGYELQESVASMGQQIGSSVSPLSLPSLQTSNHNVFALALSDANAMSTVGSHSLASATDSWYVDPASTNVLQTATADAVTAWVWKQLIKPVVGVREGHFLASKTLTDWALEPIQGVRENTFDRMTSVGKEVANGTTPVAVTSAWGNAVPNSYLVVDDTGDPTAPVTVGGGLPANYGNSGYYDATYIGLKKLFSARDSHPIPLALELRAALADTGAYWPDVLHRWGLPTDTCDVRAPAAGDPTRLAIERFPSSCYTGAPNT